MTRPRGWRTTAFPRNVGLGTLWVLALLFIPAVLHAHGVSAADRQAMESGGALQYVWLGATHMLTGYDHLLFLVGVVFFLTGFRDVVLFITAFTVGHSITLLGATLYGVSANPYLIDAVIALSVVYKGFENLDGFKRFLKVGAPSLLWMVFAFGLIHGFGLSTRLQELPLGDEGLVVRILAFNAGVELGQIAALSVILMFFAAWRKSASFTRFSTAANVGLVLAGIGLFVFQVNGFLHHGAPHDHDHAEAHGHEHGETHDPEEAHDQGEAHDPGEAHDHGKARRMTMERHTTTERATTMARHTTTKATSGPPLPTKTVVAHVRQVRGA